MSGKHTDDYYEALTSLNIDVERSEVASWLRNQSYLQQDAGVNFSWEFTKSHKKEDAEREFSDAFNRRGNWMYFANEGETEDEYLSRLFDNSKDVDEEMEALFKPIDDVQPKRSIELAAAFPGEKYIVEYEDELIYIPESRYCGVRALAKSIDLTVRDFMKMKNANPTGMSIRDVYTLIKRYCQNEEKPIKDEDLPDTYTWRQSENRFRPVERWDDKNEYKIHTNNRGAMIVIRMYENCFHAIFVKDKSTINKKVTREYLYGSVTIKIKKDLDGDQDEVKQLDTTQFWTTMRQYTPDKEKRNAIVYDIETYIRHKKLPSEITKVSRKLIPYAIGWMYVEYLPKLKINEDGVVLDKPDDKRYICNKSKRELMEDVKILFPNPNCPDVVEGFWDNIGKFCAEKFPKRNWISDPMTVYAHNGGMFDHHLIKESKNIQILSTIRSGSKIKSMTAIHIPTGTHFKFLDSFMFTTMGLKQSCKGLDVPKEYWKQDFDIVDKPRPWYLANNKAVTYEIRKQFTPVHDKIFKDEMREIGIEVESNTDVDEVIKKENDWYEYLIYDVISLAFVVFNYSSSMLNVFGLEMNSCTGAAGLAWKLMMKNLTGLNDCYLPKSDVNAAFIRSAVKGGRVMHLQKTFKETDNDNALISLDINSMYPAAMERYCYPTGIPSVYNFKGALDNANLVHDWIKKGYMFIAEFAYVTGNQRNPIHAYKTAVKGETIDGVEVSGNSLIYPQCSDEENPLIDVSTSVDIIEMLKDGYKVLWVKRAIVWKKSMRLFSPLIGHLYDMRCKLKKAENPLEGLYKILLNSSYGKFLETVDESTGFADAVTWESPEFQAHRKNKKYRQIGVLPNGQIEYNNKAMFATSTKPAYIGAFILAYSKALANEYIRQIGIENIWYSDTDSFYTDKIDACKQSSVLGGIKNDYGDDSYVAEAMFVDYKRYYLEIIASPKAKTMFNRAMEAVQVNVNYGDKPFDQYAPRFLRNPGVCSYKSLEKSIIFGGKREIKAKFNGLAIPKYNVMKEQRLMITNVIEEDISTKDAMLSKNYSDLKTFFEFFVDNPGKLNDMRVIQEKWVRGKECRIDTKMFQYQVDPDKRAKWVKKGDKWVWYPLGYDFSKPEGPATEPVFYEHAKENVQVLSTKRFKCLQKMPYIIPDNNEFSGRVSLSKLKEKLGEDMGYAVDDKIFNDTEAFFMTQEGCIVKRRDHQYYKVDCYGISEPLEDNLEVHELVFALNQEVAKIDSRKICSPMVDNESVKQILKDLYKALSSRARDSLDIANIAEPPPEFNNDKESMTQKLRRLRNARNKKEPSD